MRPRCNTLRDRVAEAPDWNTRFDLVEDFCAARLGAEPAPEIGWSRQRLHQRMRNTLGLGPKPIGRMLRFRRACMLARQDFGGWASIAAEAGFADQAHLVRDFGVFAGETPTAWVRRAPCAIHACVTTPNSDIPSSIGRAAASFSAHPREGMRRCPMPPVSTPASTAVMRRR